MSTLRIYPAIALGLLLCLGDQAPITALMQLDGTLILQSPKSEPQNHPKVTIRSSFDLAGNLALADRLFEQANRDAEKIPDRAAQIRALAAVANFLDQAGRAEAAKQVFERAIALAQKTTPDFELYQQETLLQDLAVQLAQIGWDDRALSVSQSIVRDFPRAKTLQQIAEVLAAQGERQRAREVLRDALRFARGISGDYMYLSNGSCGNDKFEVLSKIAGTLSLLDQVDTALGVADSVYGCSAANGDSGADYQAWAFWGILAHVQRVEQMEQAWGIAQKTQDMVERSQIWSAIAVKWIELGDLEMALAIAQKLDKEIPETFTGYAREIGAKERAQQAIVQALVAKNQLPEAIQVAQTIAELSPSEVIKLQQQGAWAYPIKIKSATLTEIVHQLAKTRQFDQALQVADTIPDSTLKKLAWITIAAHFNQAGQVDQAEQLLKQASQTILSQPDDAESNAAMETIAIALVKSGQVKPGLQTANSIPYKLYRESALREIAVILAEQGDLETAQTLFLSLEGEGSRAIVSSQIVQKQLSLGQFQPALERLSALEDDTKAELLIRYAAPLSQTEHLDRTLELVATITDPRLRVETIAALATALTMTDSK